MQIDQGIFQDLDEILKEIELGEAEESLERLGMFDHDGFRAFAQMYGEGTADVIKELPPEQRLPLAMDLGAVFATGFYFGLAWAHKRASTASGS
jgi:hypothetical protein